MGNLNLTSGLMKTKWQDLSLSSIFNIRILHNRKFKIYSICILKSALPRRYEPPSRKEHSFAQAPHNPRLSYRQPGCSLLEGRKYANDDKTSSNFEWYDECLAWNSHVLLFIASRWRRQWQPQRRQQTRIIKIEDTRERGNEGNFHRFIVAKG